MVFLLMAQLSLEFHDPEMEEKLIVGHNHLA